MTLPAMIDGVPIVLPATWSLRTGISPAIASFEVAAGDAETLVNEARPRSSTLELGGWKYEKLSILWAEKAANPHKRQIVVACRRFWWDYNYAYRYMNWARKVGTQRREGVFNETPGLEQIVAELQFASHSLDDGVPFEPLKALRWVMKRIDPTAKVTIQDQALLRESDLQGLLIDGNGSPSVGQIMRLIASCDVTVTPDGGVRFFSWLSKSEERILGDSSLEIMGEAGPSVWNAGTVGMVDMRKVLPRKLIFLLTPEVEVRHDFVGDELTSGNKPSTGDPLTAGRVPRYVDNVLESPDLETTIVAGDGSSEKITSGTYATVKQLLDAWSAQGGRGLLTTGVLFRHLRRAMLPWNQTLWRDLELLEQTRPVGEVQFWGRRIAAIQDGYRQLYRLRKQWVDNSIAIKAEQVGTWERTSGSRARALVWMDHAVVPSMQGRWNRAAYADKMPWILNVDGYPGEDVEITSAHIQAPLAVSIEDEAQGIVRLSPATDKFNGSHQTILPSKVANIPTGDRRPSNKGAVYTNAGTIRKTSRAELSTEQNIAMILTMTPANVLFPFEVTATELGYKGEGPPMYVRIPSARETARFRWAQGAAPAVEIAWGLGGKAFTPEDGMRRLSEYCVNLRSNASGAASIEKLCKAMGRAILAEKGSRFMGAAQFDQLGAAGGLAPEGGIETVSHTVGRNGSAITSVGCRSQRPSVDFVAYLDSATRDILVRRVKPK